MSHRRFSNDSQFYLFARSTVLRLSSSSPAAKNRLQRSADSFCGAQLVNSVNTSLPRRATQRLVSVRHQIVAPTCSVARQLVNSVNTSRRTRSKASSALRLVLWRRKGSGRALFDCARLRMSRCAKGAASRTSAAPARAQQQALHDLLS